jgi:hypothetical protein
MKKTFFPIKKVLKRVGRKIEGNNCLEKLILFYFFSISSGCKLKGLFLGRNLSKENN